MPARQMGVILAIISGTAFGAMAIFTKYAYLGGVNVITALFIRFLTASSMFWFVLSLRKGERPVETNDKLKLLCLGMFGYALVSACFFQAVKLIPATLAALLLYLYPSLVYLANVFLKYERLQGHSILALMLTTVGTYFVVGVSFNNGNIFGILFGTMSAVIYSFFIVIGSKIVKRVGPIESSAYIITGAAIFYIVTGLIHGNLIFQVSAFTWLMMVATGIISTLVAMLTFWLSVDYIGSSMASIISTIEPLVTALLAFFLFQELLDQKQLIGGLLIILGVLIIQLRTTKSFENEYVEEGSLSANAEKNVPTP